MKFVYKLINFFLFFLLCSTTRAQVTNTYTSSTSWTVPAGVTSVTLKLYGGAGGTGGQDCGAGCTNAASGQVGYVEAVFNVTPGDIIYIYPGGNGVNGSNNITGAGGGNGGVSTYSAAYNGGKGGNAGSSGSSGGGGGGGAASIIKINSTIVIVAGGAGGGGGMANQAASGQAGFSTTSANGTSNTGGNGTTPSGDGGGGAGGGGGQYGSLGGGVHAAGGESAGNGGYRGANAVTGASSVITNGTATWTTTGQIQITYAASTLPVVWQSFSAVLSGAKVILNWSTAAETASKKFIIQHSTDGRTWENTGELPAAINSAGQHYYSFIHVQPSEGGNFYRILELDQDGQSSFSKVVFIRNDKSSNGITIYPNPVVNKVLNIQTDQAGWYTICNSIGIRVWQQHLGIGTTPINLKNLPAGSYYLQTKGRAIRFVLF